MPSISAEALLDRIQAVLNAETAPPRTRLDDFTLSVLGDAVASAMEDDMEAIVGTQRLAFASKEDLVYPSSATEARKMWFVGFSAILQSLHASPGIINAICATLEVRESRRVSCSAYISEPQADTFDLHTDDWDAFIIQLQGQKTFWIEDQESCEVDPVKLTPGDVLYLKRHVRHRATSDSNSLHITINILRFPMRLEGDAGEVSS